MRVYLLIAISRAITDGQSLAEMLDSSSGVVGVFLTREDALRAMDAYPSIDGNIELRPYIYDMDGYPWHKEKGLNTELGFTIDEFEIGSLYPFGLYPRQEFKL